MLYLQFLAKVHELLRPRRYLEIGIRNGVSLSLAQCPAVGIDPYYTITAELHNQVHLYRTTSDEYFTRPDPLAPTGGQPFDLAFIDGLHLFEFAFRDFVNAERHSSPGGVIIFDDVLPRSVDEAARERHTGSWTGDVYPMLEVLARYRPELVVLPVGTEPTGLLLVLGTDPQNTVLADHYSEIMAEFRHPDPQPVPPDLLDRMMVLPPQRVLDSPFWQLFGDLRETTPTESWRSRLADTVADSLGPAFARAPIR
jgi:Methyltransferase domain